MYPLSPLFACFRVRFVSRDMTMTLFYDHPLQIMYIRHIIAPVKQKSFGFVYIGTIYIFLVVHCYT